MAHRPGRHGRPERRVGRRTAGAPAAGAGGDSKGPDGGRERQPLIVLDGHAAVQAAVGRRYSYSGDRLMPDRFYAYVDANAGRIALTAGARSGADSRIRSLGGPRTKKRTVLAEEIDAMASADASGYEAWLGSIEAMQRGAAGDPQSRTARRWMRLREDSLPRIILGEDRPWTECHIAKLMHPEAYMVKNLDDKGRAYMLGWLYDHAASARLVAAEAARVAEGSGGRGAILVAMNPDILAFAGELEAATGGRLRVLDADRVSLGPTKKQKAERAERLRRLVPRRGQPLTTAELKRRLGTKRLGRLTAIKGEKIVVIVRERDDGLTYARKGFVMCVGEGGENQQMDRNNKAIRDAGPEGHDILLFERTDADRLAFVSRLGYVSHRIRRVGEEGSPFGGRIIVFKLKRYGGVAEGGGRD